MLSKNQLRAIFLEISVKHWMIHDFGYGRKWTRQEPTSPEAKIYYPCLWVVPMGSTMPNGEQRHTYRIAVMDLVQKGEGNEMEVESDTYKILSDVISLLNNKKLYPSLTLDRNVVSVDEVVHEVYQDEISGHAATITLKTDFDANYCAVSGVGFGEENPIQYSEGDFYETYVQSKSITIGEPLVGDDIPMTTVIRQAKLSQVFEVVIGSGTITYNIYFAATKDAASPSKVWTSDRVVGSESGVNVTSFDTNIIPKDYVIWVEISAKTGTIDIFHTTIFFNNKI